MIQRIQSLYLLIVVILNSLLFILPLNEMNTNNGILKLSILGLSNSKTGQYTELFPLLALTIIIILIALFTIFLYKNRKIQMRLSLYNSVLGLSLSFLAIYYASQIANSNQTSLGFSVGLLIPIIGSIISFLAFKAIQKDDKLVKSIDRIR